MQTNDAYLFIAEESRGYHRVVKAAVEAIDPDDARRTFLRVYPKAADWNITYQLIQVLTSDAAVASGEK